MLLLQNLETGGEDDELGGMKGNWRAGRLSVVSYELDTLEPPSQIAFHGAGVVHLLKIFVLEDDDGQTRWNGREDDGRTYGGHTSMNDDDEVWASAIQRLRDYGELRWE